MQHLESHVLGQCFEKCVLRNIAGAHTIPSWNVLLYAFMCFGFCLSIGTASKKHNCKDALRKLHCQVANPVLAPVYNYVFLPLCVCVWVCACVNVCVSIRSRLADFQHNCQPSSHSPSGCMRESGAVCLKAYAGLIGELERERD